MNGWRILHVRQRVEQGTGRDRVCYFNSLAPRGIPIVGWAEMGYRLKDRHATCPPARLPLPSPITPGTQNPGPHVTYFQLSYLNIRPVHLVGTATKTEPFLVEVGTTKRLPSSFVSIQVNRLAIGRVLSLVLTVALSLIGQNSAAARMEMCLVREK